MLTHQVRRLQLTGILDSRGQRTIEARVVLGGGGVGVGSSPTAIAPGRRERMRTAVPRLGSLDELPAMVKIRRLFEGELWWQREFDRALVDLMESDAIGSNFALALSLAFCRASCAEQHRPFHEYLAEMAGTHPCMPHPLINVFSGGIHKDRAARDFQQIMVAPRFDTVVEDIAEGAQLFEAVRWRLEEASVRYSYSASSGMVVEGLSSEWLWSALVEELRKRPHADQTHVAVDAAGEHLSQGNGTYRLGFRTVTGEELFDFYVRLVRERRLSYLEDPFTPCDHELWHSLKVALGPTTCVVGDDLFATNTAHIDSTLAGGIVLKMSQVGTLTETLRAARMARENGLQVCVSHRSGETEDTAMCDLAVGLGADFIKLGGPRSGDRTAKYNQLLRLFEYFAMDPESTAPSPASWARTTVMSGNTWRSR